MTLEPAIDLRPPRDGAGATAAAFDGAANAGTHVHEIAAARWQPRFDDDITQ